MANSITPCVRSFILFILCGNPILKGVFVTTLSGLVVTLDAEITVLTAQLGRLNIINQLASIEINTLNAIQHKTQAELNLILGPLSSASTCPQLAALLQDLQSSSVSKAVVGRQNQIYKANKSLNLAAAQQAIISQKQQLRQFCLDMIQEIALLCGS
jgi:hypothetical protein